MNVKSGAEQGMNVSWEAHPFKCGVIIYRGSSMYPFLKSGDRITLINRFPKIGDIIVFRKDGVNLIHRVIRVTGNSFVTKGDNIEERDGFRVRVDEIIGVVSGINNKRVSSFLNRLIALLSAYNLTPGPLKRRIFKILGVFENNLRRCIIMLLTRNKISYVVYKRGEGIEIKALFKNKTIGRSIYKDNILKSIWIRRLYRDIGIEKEFFKLGANITGYKEG